MAVALARTAHVGTRGPLVNHTLYEHPEKYGLRTFGEVEWVPGAYGFDLTVVWRDTSTGDFFFAQDAGCSCPDPFENVDRSGLKKISTIQDIIDHVENHYQTRVTEEYPEPREVLDASRARAGELIMKVRSELNAL